MYSRLLSIFLGEGSAVHVIRDYSLLLVNKSSDGARLRYREGGGGGTAIYGLYR